MDNQEEILEMFCPEPDQMEDIPPAPDVADFPVGCEVQLVNESVARLVHPEVYWEPLMNEMFAQKQVVQVQRHTGDYTFVAFERQNMKLGCTIHRACLRDPRMYKRYSGSAAEPANIPFVVTQTAAKSESEPQTEPNLGEFSSPASDSPIELCTRGNRAFRRSCFEQAVECYSLALKYPGQHRCRVYANRSAGHLALGLSSVALEDALLAIRTDPNDVRGYIRAGNAYRALRQCSESEKMYRQAASIDPSNVEVSNLLRANAVSLHYDDATRHMPVAVALQGTENVTLLTLRRIKRGRIVFEEKPMICICSMLPQNTPRHCSQCLRNLVHPETVAEHLQARDVESIFELAFGQNRSVLQCPSGCGAIFCSQQCCDDAQEAHHWMECPVSGQWSIGLRRIGAIIEEENMSLNDATSLWLVIRMLAWILSRKEPLETAVKTFKWMRRHDHRGYEGTLLEQHLHKCYDAVYPHLKPQEATFITFSLFQQCFEQAASCAVRFTVSPWKRFVSTVEMHIELMQLKPATAPTARRLQRMLPASGKDVPDMWIDVTALFFVISTCTSSDTPNVSIHTGSSGMQRARVIALRHLKSGELITSSL